MHFTIFYFSGTGNTKWAVEELDRIITKSDMTLSAYSIENGIADGDIQKALEASDFIGFASPIYGADMPRIMREFIKRVNACANGKYAEKKAFLINTYAYVNGCGVFRARGLLDKNIFDITGYINLRLSMNTPSRKNIPALLGEDLPDNIKVKAFQKLSKFVDKAKNSKTYIMGAGPHLLIGSIIRKKLKNEIEYNYKSMKVDLSKCTKCLVCVQNCPVNAIKYQNGEFIFNEKCEACMRCYNGCKAKAISNS